MASTRGGPAVQNATLCTWCGFEGAVRAERVVCPECDRVLE